VEALVRAVDENADRLSALDGAIGDGDHGVNMRKGFLLARARIGPNCGLADCLSVLGATLLDDIGGATGPLYGSMFEAMAEAVRGKLDVNATVFGEMLEAAVQAILDLGGARPGDKTIVDVLVPAREAYRQSLEAKRPFDESLRAMVLAADAGRDSTRSLTARVGRASRLGARSVGAIDPGSASAALILGTMASTITTLLGDDRRSS
jgi:phosphoenolpyruvate---glycerone phosphotransferase subunit DhaL